MPFSNLDAELLNTFGAAGSYTLQGGSAVATQILIEEEIDPFGGAGFETRTQETGKVAFVLASVATDPKRGDTLTVGTTTYLVREVLNDDGLLVKLSVRAQ